MRSGIRQRGSALQVLNIATLLPKAQAWEVLINVRSAVRFCQSGEFAESARDFHLGNDFRLPGESSRLSTRQIQS
jgi:hypothetical protein